MPGKRGYETRSGENSYAWKGNDAGYVAIHSWRARHRPKSGTCSSCGTEAITEWANLGRYDRLDESDWRELCRSCHRKMDAVGFDPVIAKRNRSKTHCANGHELTDSNVYVHQRVRRGKVYPERQCRTCHRDRERRRKLSQAVR